MVHVYSYAATFVPSMEQEGEEYKEISIKIIKIQSGLPCIVRLAKRVLHVWYRMIRPPATQRLSSSGHVILSFISLIISGQ